MTPIHHIAIPEDWEAAGDEYRMSTRGLTLDEQGFIHCSYEHQIQGVLDAFYADVDEVLVVTIDPEGLDVRAEPPGPGVDQLFPHIYGPLPRASVTNVVRLHPSRGSMR